MGMTTLKIRFGRKRRLALFLLIQQQAPLSMTNNRLQFKTEQP